MSDDLIRYDILTQDALRRVIRKVLEEVQRSGLPGEHHFFITFQTGFPGVRLSARMMERYPEEMTIVVQHTFWNLDVSDSAFEIDLSFDDIRERLRIPFDAIRGFYDPSVKFGLQFDVSPMAALPKRESTDAAPQKSANPPAASGKPAAKARPALTVAKPGAKTGDEGKKEEAGAEVVSLDSFRKKK
jgi:hypothetical protein